MPVVMFPDAQSVPPDQLEPVGVESVEAAAPGPHKHMGEDGGNDRVAPIEAELGVAPLREDWQEVLSETQTAHETWRTWPTPGAPPEQG